MTYELPPAWDLHYQLPPELLRWGWAPAGMKSGPRKNPGGWYEFLFYRQHGLAAGDADLPFDDASLKVKMRRPTVEEALMAAVEEMLERSSVLIQAEDHPERYEAITRMTPPFLCTSSLARNDQPT